MWMCVSMSTLTALRSSLVIMKSSIMERQGNVLWILRWRKEVSFLVFHSRLRTHHFLFIVFNFKLLGHLLTPYWHVMHAHVCIDFCHVKYAWLLFRNEFEGGVSTRVWVMGPVSPTRHKVGAVPHALPMANCPCQVAKPHTKYWSPADLQHIWYWSFTDISPTSLDRAHHPYERERAAKAGFL